MSGIDLYGKILGKRREARELNYVDIKIYPLAYVTVRSEDAERAEHLLKPIVERELVASKYIFRLHGLRKEIREVFNRNGITYCRVWADIE